LNIDQKIIFCFHQKLGSQACKTKRLPGGAKGVNVPPGLINTMEVCQEFYVVGARLPDGLLNEISRHRLLHQVRAGVTFADPTSPLRVLVRSGVAISMPGLMDTVLSLNLKDENVKGVARRGGERFVYDCYLLQMFRDVMLEIGSTTSRRS
jgi:pyruvate,orthophosphate dikinase